MSKPHQPNVAIRALQDGTVELDIFDAIGETFLGVTAKHVAGLLREHSGKAIKVRINSPGGSAAEGAAIYNLLKAHGAPVSVEVIGVAASAASLLAMSGEPVRMAENALLMIHDPWNIAVGNAEDLRHAAEALDKDAGALAKTYARKTGKPVQEIRELMLAETWLDADEALEQGFADEIIETSSAAAYLGEKQREAMAKFRHMPSAAAAFLRAEADKPRRPLGAAWRAAGGAAAAAAKARPLDAHDKTTATGTPPAPQEKHMNLVAIAAMLSLAEGADEAAVTAAIQNLQGRAKLAADFEAAAGATGAEAVGKVRGLVESQAQLAERVESLETDKQRGELAKLLDEHSKPGARKVTPATRAHYEAQFDAAGDKAAFIAETRGYLAVAPTVGGAEPKQPPVQASASASAAITGPGGKTYAEMSNAERDALWRSDPDTFRAMRDEFKRQA